MNTGLIILTIALFVLFVIGTLILTHNYKNISITTEEKITALLPTYSKKKNHPLFGKVVVVIKGDKDACIKKTIHSVLNQNIKVDEISTCDTTDLSSNVCKKIVNVYSDPYNIGLIRSTFEREFDADTIAVFLRCGDVLPSNEYISNALDLWSIHKPYEHNNPYTLVISEAQLSAK